MPTDVTTTRDQPTPRKPLRLWPGVLLAILLLLVKFIVPVFIPSFIVFSVLGGVGGALLIVLWWLFFSRAPWLERFGALALMPLALFATSRIIDKSIATGAMGMLFPILSIPILSIAFVAWAVATRRLSDRLRRVTMVATILLASGVWALVRTGGFSGNFKNDFAWRWSKNPEERLLAKSGDEPAARTPTTSQPKKSGDWPGFRGPARNG